MFFPRTGMSPQALDLGFRQGEKGTHTSRTIMLKELEAVFRATSPTAKRDDYADAVIDGNCLGKPTASTRRLTDQRLSELYALDPLIPIFRVMRRLWGMDELGRPLLALMLGLARDPLLMATAPVIISLPPGAELARNQVREVLRAAVGARLNDSILDKVVRNTSSSWTQSGHLVGRTFKVRRAVTATPSTVAFALYLGYFAGLRGEELMASGWVATLDCGPGSARTLLLDAKRLHLIDLRMAGNVVELGLEHLDPWDGRI